MLTKVFINPRKGKLMLLMLLTMLVVEGGNSAWAQKAMPYSYGFEEASCSTSGWTKVSCHNSSENYNIGTSGAYEGDYAFRFYYRSNPPQYLISPELATSSYSLNVSFWYKAHSTSYEESFQVGYSTTDAETSSFTFGDEVKTGSTNWQEYTTTCPAGTKYICIACTSNNQYFLYIDDLVIDFDSPYKTPKAFASTGVTATTATFGWTARGDETAWQIAYSTTKGFDADAATKVDVTSNPYTLEGLTAETTYYARIRADYGSGNYSAWSNEVSFKPTNAIDLTVNDGTTMNNYVPFNGNYADTQGTMSQFIIPALSLTAMQGRQITDMTFYTSTATKDFGNARFDVYMAETSATTFDAATFDWSDMDQVAASATVNIADGKMTITLDNGFEYSGDNLKIGFKLVVTGGYTRTSWYGIAATNAAIKYYSGGGATIESFLPKITFTSMPGPAVKRPRNLAVTPGSTTAEVTWTGDAETFDIDVNGTVTEGVASPYTLENLTPATTYTVKVRGRSGNDVSGWSGTVSFTTYVYVTGVTLAQTEGVLTVGETLTLTATIAPTNAKDKSVTWTTSDASVATVDGNGVVTAQGLGKATITATATNGTADTSDDVTATCTVNVYPWAGSGTADDPFQIQNVDDWNTLAANVTGGKTYSGIYFKMTDDIIGVTTRTGKNSVNPFSGTFDGQGHTMNLNIYSTTTADVTSAPFGAISGATIKNLHITGSETTTAYMRAASIAGFAANSTITNCWSEVALTAGYGKDIDCGAFVATVIENSSLTLNGCLFTGTITYTNATGYEGGGMVGWTRAGSTATLNDCLFAPASFTVTKYYGHYMFVGGKKRGVLNNCYYNDVAAATSLVKEGKQAFSIIKGDDVSSLAISGEGTEYSVSGITAYATGIKYNDVYYAGSGEAVGLTLSHADREGYTFSAYAVTGGGTLADATTDTPTLTMSEADAVVSAMWLLPTDETGAYLISSAGDWNSFCYDVNNGNAYSGKTVKLTQDISEAVNTTAGTSETLSFQGTFDGQAHTLNVNITDNSNSPAPFRYIKNATIRNLVVTGNITSSQKHVAGLAKATYGDILIENCNVAATISGARYMGGFIGHSQAAQVTINGCVFSGTLSPTDSDYTGGFICWGEGVTGNTMAVTNSLFCGTLAGSGSSKFHPIGFNYTPANPTRVFTNTYYTIAAKNIDEDTDEKSFVNGLDAESKGKQAYALATAPANLGDLVQGFGVMTAYENGILCGDIYYVAPADITLHETEAGEVTAVDGYFSNVTLTRTLQAGSYNTFAAPFDISVSELSTKGITTVKELQSSTFADGVLTLNFADAESIEAGKPYLVKVSEKVVNPTFSGVTISSTTTTTETTAVDFIPVVNKTYLTGGDKTVLFVVGGNKLTYPSGNGNINGFRAYFKLKPEVASLARAFRMSFGDDATGINEIYDLPIHDSLPNASGIYTLDGRSIEGQPTQRSAEGRLYPQGLKKGVYIVNGKKTVIK